MAQAHGPPADHGGEQRRCGGMKNVRDDGRYRAWALSDEDARGSNARIERTLALGGRVFPTLLPDPVPSCGPPCVPHVCDVRVTRSPDTRTRAIDLATLRERGKSLVRITVALHHENYDRGHTRARTVKYHGRHTTHSESNS